MINSSSLFQSEFACCWKLHIKFPLCKRGMSSVHLHLPPFVICSTFMSNRPQALGDLRMTRVLWKHVDSLSHEKRAA